MVPVVSNHRKPMERILHALVAARRAVVGAAVAFAGYIARKRKEYITLMLVPHSEKKMLNLQFSVLTVAMVVFVVGGATCISGGVLLYSLLWKSESVRMERKAEELELIQKDITRLKGMLDDMRPELESTSRYLSGELQVSFPGVGGESDTAPIFKKYSKEYYILKDFDINLSYQQKVIRALNKYLDQRKEVIARTPALWPIDDRGGYITSRFGERFDPISGHVGFHKGIDIACWPGEKVIATGPGTVLQSGWHDEYGLKVTIRHDYGFETTYGHNRRLLVGAGQHVKAGQPIALAGNTGKSTGVHVHYEVHIGGEAVDPTPYLLLNTY